MFEGNFIKVIKEKPLETTVCKIKMSLLVQIEKGLSKKMNLLFRG